MKLFVLFFLLYQATDCLSQNNKLAFGLYFGNDFNADTNGQQRNRTPANIDNRRCKAISAIIQFNKWQKAL